MTNAATVIATFFGASYDLKAMNDNGEIDLALKGEPCKYDQTICNYLGIEVPCAATKSSIPPIYLLLAYSDFEFSDSVEFKPYTNLITEAKKLLSE